MKFRIDEVLCGHHSLVTLVFVDMLLHNTITIGIAIYGIYFSESSMGGNLSIAYSGKHFYII